MKSKITVRQKKFDFSNTPKYFYSDSKLITHFFNALSSTFPPGEEFFVRSVRRFRKNDNSDLEKDISGFIGQEAWHSMAHETLNKYAEFHNVPLLKWDSRIEKLLTTVEKKITPKMCLAITVALEHYTASMGNELLNNNKWLDGFAEPYNELLKWHATEEVEHRNVAYDVYVREGNDYLLKTSVMIGASIIFWILISYMTCDLFFKDKDMSKLTKIYEFLYGVNQLIGHKGFVTNILKDIPMYFKPSFHPSQMN